ncbi:probable cation-transporting ATPase W08D2.5 [Trichogramma pretiosum]|uniref:probable cation-transporting ATPase W08D2.5 n=1 Tax=Trichogramma pretiosum TaxID=7493 RepID=UPI0006C9DF91|nr:probable cation-transporting ATPase W08D2.5 [Trichogramma pretiosum]
MTSINDLKDVKNFGLTCQKIQDSQDEQMTAYGYERNWARTTATWLACLLSAGILRLFFHWYPHLYLYATHRSCGLSRATKILIVDDYQGKYKSYTVKEIKIVSTRNLSSDTLRRRSVDTDKDLLEKIRNRPLELNLENGCKQLVLDYKAFWCKKQCYVWDEELAEFSKLASLERHARCKDLHSDKIKGLSREEQLLRRIMYGFNEILVPVQGYEVLFFLEILNPFYVFQVFSLFVWFLEEYYQYAIAVMCMSICGIITSIRQTRANQVSLRNTVAQTESVRVLRSSGDFETVSSDELVPGDIIELPRHRAVIACDAILLTGTCVVNESMLTGESVPVTKTPLQPNDHLYDSREHAYHTLFSGTTIIQSKQYGDKPVLAKIIRTGLWTNKGSLVCAIMYPPPADFKFDQDSYKLIAILISVAFVGFFYTLAIMIQRGNSALNIVIKTLTVFTIVVPPALPSVMAVGKMYAIFRLKGKQIYCINTRAINISGSIDCVCFDKTGTLTEDGLDMMGVAIRDGNVLLEPEKDVRRIEGTSMFQGMLTCHSLTLIDEELSGDPLDIKMFESTGWQLDDRDLRDPQALRSEQVLAVVRPSPSKDESDLENSPCLEIIQQYQFSSTLQRMSAIARLPQENDRFVAFTKGSPEMVLSLSRPETVPQDLALNLKLYTEQGYRVIALARKDIQVSAKEVHKIPRDEIEKDLEFLGLIILENRLKKPTIGVIKDLREANVKTIMITGDNIQTAISVAKECGILSYRETVINVSVVPCAQDKNRTEIFFNAQGLPMLEKKMSLSMLGDLEYGSYPNDYKLALTGDTWQLLREHHAELLPRICTKGVVFARMSSDQKQQLVVELMQLGYHVAMCGDGANDCGALRAAHVGISLSEAESSVASPFTSRVPDIRCVPTVIQQGRAALVTSFGIFKFTVCYSLTEFISTIILYTISSNFTDLQFLYVDILLFVNFAFFFGKTEAYEGKLARTPPTSSLVSFTPLFSIAMHTVFIAVFELVAFYATQEFSWFTPFKPEDEYRYDCYENYSVFSLSTFQYAMLAIVFSMGKPYRKSMFTNRWFCLSIFVLTLLNVYITIYPAKWVSDILKLQMPPAYDWRFAIVGLAVLNFVICLAFEAFIVDYVIQKKIKPRLYKPEKSKKPFLRLEYELKEDHNWPPISNELPHLPVTPSYENIVNTTRKASIAESAISVRIVNETETTTQRNAARALSCMTGINNSAFENHNDINTVD